MNSVVLEPNVARQIKTAQTGTLLVDQAGMPLAYAISSQDYERFLLIRDMDRFTDAEIEAMQKSIDKEYTLQEILDSLPKA